MYRLHPNADLSFFCGKALQQVCIGVNEIILRFDDYISVTIMSPIGFIPSGSAYHKYEDYRDAAAAVVALLQEVVVSAKGDESGTMSLVFYGGGRLEIYDDSERYEAYIIQHGDHVIVV